MSNERKKELVDKLVALQHACMTGAGYLIQNEPKAAEPKNVRNGIDAVMVQHQAVVKLLIQKGVFTEEEYLESMVECFEEEKARYEKDLSERYGANITLH